MEVASHYVGTELKAHHSTITWRDTMNYAAAIMDNNPIYFDDEKPGSIVSHPMQCVAVTWPILERIWEFIELEDFPTDILMTQVHYTEHLVLHRLIQPNDTLTIKGNIAAILPHRAGTHMITRLDAFDEKGEPVFTEFIGGLMRGVECTDQGRGNENIPIIPKAEKNNSVKWESTIAIDHHLPFVYDGCSRIHFPIHTSKQFAHQVGLPDIILQGTATLALAIREIVNLEAGADPNKVQSISCRFTGMVVTDSTITVQLLNRNNSGDIFFQVLNSHGQPAISYGYVKLNS